MSPGADITGAHRPPRSVIATAGLSTQPLLRFEDVFASEAPFVGRTLLYLGVKGADVEDAAQEVFVVVLRQLASFGGGSVRAWVRQICVNVARNHRRSQMRRREELVDEPPEPPPAEGEVPGERAQQRQRLLAALDRLGEEQRSVFVLFEIEELPMTEVAGLLGCPLQTAYTRLYSARSRLETWLREFKEGGRS